ncbi:MAG: bifunctional proline dehydrogenase/L-glutamate gamma-semialdehyde dehydrogenase PutA, partial [Hyphomicrobiaceae bacterium]
MATIEMASNSNPDRSAIRENWVVDEAVLIERLVRETRLDAEQRSAISARAADLVAQVRALSRPSMMESFLAEYGLSTDEGVGLMCLAEALLRVPDADTVDALISDKIEPGNWGAHLGQSSSMLVNAATWALLITGRVLDDVSDGPARSLRALVKRVGEPVVRAAVARAIRILGDQFVLGETIEAAVARADRFEALGYTYSYDMLGEAARTHDDAARYLGSYRNAIEVAGRSGNGSVAERAGVSIKLSALHPRYEWTNRNAVRNELVPIIADLATEAADHGIGLNIDAEEANRLEVSLDVIADVIADPRLSGWSGLGIVVQAYGSRALPVIDWLHALAAQHERRIMVRLVKGAYWDSEVKHAQVLGLPGYPVFTRKPHTDVSYLAAARRLLDAGDRIYPQFATHNAHTAAAVHAMTSGRSPHSYEFQRLHGMGEALHEILRSNFGTRCRIYAPVGAHQDLLAYLVRRLLENGANSSFVNQIVDEDIPPSVIASDPIAAIATGTEARAQGRGGDAVLPAPASIFEPVRRNSKGYDVNEPASIEALRADVERFRVMRWTAEPIVHGTRALESDHVPAAPIFNPARSDDHVGSCRAATPAEIAAALDTACAGVARWSATPATDRASALRRAAELFEANTAELCALCMREAGKTLTDAIAEVREAVDFLTYYAHELERRAVAAPVTGRGLFVCISPWNFPLAIFTGQIAAALAAGNTVIAKPPEQTPLVAARAVDLLLAAGVAPDALQLLPGDGPSVGAPLTGDPRVAGVCFTGSTEVARLIDRSLASNAPHAVLIAETGGLNAMVVDSTALPEQAVRDIVSSAFQSAGQRCSALRVLY